MRDVQLGKVGYKSAIVSWHPPLLPHGVISHYRVLYWQDDEVVPLARDWNPNHDGEAVYTLTGLLPGTDYRLKVMAVNDAGPGEMSREDISFTTREGGEES